MKNRRRLALGFAGVVALGLGLGYFWRQSILYHTLSWQRATRDTVGDSTWWDRICGTLIGRPQFQSSWEQAKHHEMELLKMGYLTNCTFRLTNEVMTVEFHTNFFRLIRLRTGTNYYQVWTGPSLPDRTGIAPTFPTKDYAIWEQTFRECASLYASNVPPASVTSETVRATK